VVSVLGRILRAAEARVLDGVARVRQALVADSVTLDPTARLLLEARVEPLAGDRASIVIGANTHVRGRLLTAAHGGRITIGRWCYIGEGTRIWSAASIIIGDRVLVSHGCDVHDWDAHPLEAEARHAQFRHIVEQGHAKDAMGSLARPILIEDDAWIGFGATILKGVTIGRGSVVAARALVVDNVPPGVVVGGVPARVLRTL
jgi:acetyltransferase-like isoleucine patch superfamily enzyme